MAIADSTKLVSHLAHALGSPTDVEYCLRYRQAVLALAADTAGTTASLVLADEGKDIVVTSIVIVPGAAVAESNMNYKTINFKTGDKAGGALSAAIATKTTQPVANGGTGSWVARTAITLFSGLQTVTAAQTAYLELAVTGGGVALNGASFVVTYYLA